MFFFSFTKFFYGDTKMKFLTLALSPEKFIQHSTRDKKPMSVLDRWRGQKLNLMLIIIMHCHGNLSDVTNFNSVMQLYYCYKCKFTLYICKSTRCRMTRQGTADRQQQHSLRWLTSSRRPVVKNTTSKFNSNTDRGMQVPLVRHQPTQTPKIFLAHVTPYPWQLGVFTENEKSFLTERGLQMKLGQKYIFFVCTSFIHTYIGMYKISTL